MTDFSLRLAPGCKVVKWPDSRLTSLHLQCVLSFPARNLCMFAEPSNRRKDRRRILIPVNLRMPGSSAAVAEQAGVGVVCPPCPRAKRSLPGVWDTTGGADSETSHRKRSAPLTCRFGRAASQRDWPALHDEEWGPKFPSGRGVAQPSLGATQCHDWWCSGPREGSQRSGQPQDTDCQSLAVLQCTRPTTRTSHPHPQLSKFTTLLCVWDRAVGARNAVRQELAARDTWTVVLQI